MPEPARDWPIRTSVLRGSCAVCENEISACAPHRYEPLARLGRPRRRVHLHCAGLPIPEPAAPSEPPF